MRPQFDDDYQSHDPIDKHAICQMKMQPSLIMRTFAAILQCRCTIQIDFHNFSSQTNIEATIKWKASTKWLKQPFTRIKHKTNTKQTKKKKKKEKNQEEIWEKRRRNFSKRRIKRFTTKLSLCCFRQHSFLHISIQWIKQTTKVPLLAISLEIHISSKRIRCHKNTQRIK